MPVIKITHTRNLSGRFGVQYATEQSDPHNSDDPFINKRVLALDTLRCSKNNFLSEMQATCLAYGTKQRNRVELYRITQSFSRDEADPHSPADIKKVNQAGVELARQLYPGHQVVVATQADGRNHCLHNHIDVMALDYSTGKALRGKAVHMQDVAKVSDRVVSKMGFYLDGMLRYGDPTRHSNSKLETRLSDLKRDSDIVDWDSFQQIASNKYNLEVKINVLRRGKRKGQTQLKFRATDLTRKSFSRDTTFKNDDYTAAAFEKVFERNHYRKNPSAEIARIDAAIASSKASIAALEASKASSSVVSVAAAPLKSKTMIKPLSTQSSVASSAATPEPKKRRHNNSLMALMRLIIIRLVLKSMERTRVRVDLKKERQTEAIKAAKERAFVERWQIYKLAQKPQNKSKNDDLAF